MMLSILLFQLLTSLSFSFSDVPSMSELAGLKLTDEMAQELGMQDATKYIKVVEEQFQQFGQYGMDVEDDETNRYLSPVVIIVNKSNRTPSNPEGQTAKLFLNGKLEGQFDVATGINQMVETTSGKLYFAQTPVGFYRIKKAYDQYFSNAFFGAYMRYAMFFSGGVALHATENVDSLGRIGSGGCVRMRDEDIAQISQAILETGEPHRETKKEVICRQSQCFDRELYTNRIRLNDLNANSGKKTNSLIMTYDAYVIVKEGSRYEKESNDIYDI